MVHEDDIIRCLSVADTLYGFFSVHRVLYMSADARQQLHRDIDIYLIIIYYEDVEFQLLSIICRERSILLHLIELSRSLFAYPVK